MSLDPRWTAVLFDLDGTLADTVELILLAFRHTMIAHLGEPPPDEHFLESIGTPLPEQLRAFARNEEERKSMLATYVTYQWDVHDDMVRPFPGAREVVQELRSRGSLVGVVTSKGRRIAAKTMSVCGFTDAVDFVVCGDEVKRGKPDPEPVLHAMNALGVAGAPREVVFVGDSTHDMRAGRAAGTLTAAVGWGPIERRVLEAESPDFYVDRMEDLLRISPER